jgi:hypothetical protein
MCLHRAVPCVYGCMCAVCLLICLYQHACVCEPCSLLDFDISSGAEFLLEERGSPLLVGCGGVALDVLCVTIPNLLPNHIYVFRIAAITEIGVRTSCRCDCGAWLRFVLYSAHFRFQRHRVCACAMCAYVPGKSTFSESSPTARTKFLEAPSPPLNVTATGVCGPPSHMIH